MLYINEHALQKRARGGYSDFIQTGLFNKFFFKKFSFPIFVILFKGKLFSLNLRGWGKVCEVK